MQLLVDAQRRVRNLLQENASTLLTAGGVVGTVTTAVLTCRATFKAAEVIEFERIDLLNALPESDEIPDLPELDRNTKIKLVWTCFIPPTLMGSATIGSIIMANRMSAQKAAALAAAYGLAEGRLNEYKEKVAEKLTPAKEQKIQDEIAQEKVSNTPGASQIIVVDGEVLCFDQSTGRYFRSTMENIKRALNSTISEIFNHEYASATYFYEELDLPGTTWTDDVGWNRELLPDLTYSTVLSEDGRPCIAIDFKVLPKPDFIPKYY